MSAIVEFGLTTWLRACTSSGCFRHTSDAHGAQQFASAVAIACVGKRVVAKLVGARFANIAGRQACGLPRDLRFYQYQPEQRFKMHKDGPWLEDGLRSELTLLVYLNEDFQGGATDFREFKVLPKTDDAVLFVHDTWHEGAVLEAGCKYVLRSDVMYS